jgi:hypothetical protein
MLEPSKYDGWRVVMQEEIYMIKENQTWELR